MKCILKSILLLSIVFSIILAGCSGEIIPVVGININLNETTIGVDGVRLLTAEIEPADATNDGVSWGSSDDLIAEVSGSGIVIGKSEGTATITATTEDGGFEAVCEVTVARVRVAGLGLNLEEITMTASTKKQFVPIIYPSNATNQEVSWASDNPYTASVDDDGLLTAKQAGEALLTVTSGDGGFSAQCSATVEWVATTGLVHSNQKISDTEGGFTGILHDSNYWGDSAAAVGDINGDGIPDMAVGAPYDNDGGTARGAVWIMFLNSGGTVGSYQKISDTEGGFEGGLQNNDCFGTSITSCGDLNGDGIPDIAVGEPFDDDGGVGSNDDRGAVWILFLNSDGTVDSYQKISDTEGSFSGTLDDRDLFGMAIASLGDIDGDETPDLAVGAYADYDSGPGRGAVWVLFLNSNGTVASYQKISELDGNFSGTLDDSDYFGMSVASVGDLDGDGVSDLAVGANGDDDGGSDRGAIWLLFLNSNGTVNYHQKISGTEGNFTGTLENGDGLGRSLCCPGDLNGDGTSDLVVGTPADDEPNVNQGAVRILFMDDDGTVESHQKIRSLEGGFTGELEGLDYFGISVASPGDLNGDGIADLAVGASSDDDGGSERGAVWILYMEGED